MNIELRGIQIWQVLVGAAHGRQTITYEQLSDLIGAGSPHVMARWLDRVLVYCKRQGLPPLTVLVVGKETGEPGSGITPESTTGADRERVFGLGWYALEPPSAEDFRLAQP